MRNLKLFIILLIGIALLSSCSENSENEIDEEINAKIQSIFEKVSDLRELPSLEDIDFRIISRDELHQEIIDSFDEDYPLEELAINEEVYRLLDLLDENDDLSQIIKNVRSEQVAGYYDPETKEMTIVRFNEDIGLLDELTIAHELTHALQDQHYDLQHKLDLLEDDSEALLAYTSLIEGDASVLQTLYLLSTVNSYNDLAKIIDEAAGINSEELDNAPMFIEKTLLFPYEAGTEFISAMDGWDDVNEAYDKPPVSTEQIMHPEKYLGNSSDGWVLSVSVPPIEKELGNNWTELDRDSLGELGTQIYLDTFVTKNMAESASKGWGGDKYVYFKDDSGKQLLAMHFAWDSERDAEQFFTAYQYFMDEKADFSWSIRSSGNQYFFLESPEQSVYMSVDENRSYVLIATDASTIVSLLESFSIYVP